MVEKKPFKSGQRVILLREINLKLKTRPKIPEGTIGTVVSKVGFGAIFVKFGGDYGRVTVFPNDIAHAE